MQCFQCQHENPEGARFCNACGAKLESECLACGHVNPHDSRFCNACGQTLGAVPNPVQLETQSASEAETARMEPSVSAAERRQLTVMFCDLVGSTPLSEQLDPEDLREVVRAYQQTCAEVVRRFDGHIAQLLGDGLLVYFGYPQAHEDDAQRAVRTGLELLDAMRPLNARLKQDKGIHLAIRVGIHTGLVVIGDMGGGNRQEQLALGDTPNVTSRLQGLAEPDTVVLSRTTLQLVEGYFDCDDLGLHTLKGVAEPQRVYRVRGARRVESRFAAAALVGLTPFVGREEELALVLRRWQQAKEGEGQVVLLTGEAGIGKSRLVQTLSECVEAEPHRRLRYQCSPYHCNSAFYPIITQLERAAGFRWQDTPAEKLDKLEQLLAQSTQHVAEVALLFAALLSIPSEDRYAPLHLSPQRQKTRTMEALAEQLVGLTQHQPVLLLVEDLHWCDPTSLDVLDLIVHKVSHIRAMVVMTYRPEFNTQWTTLSHVTTLTLPRLSQRQNVAMIDSITGGRALPREVLEQIVSRTDGVPLFVEELTRTVLESGLLRAVEDRYDLTGSLPPLAIPVTLQDSLMARLDRLTPVKDVVQMAATLGREFSYALLAAVSPLPDSGLQNALQQLVEAGLLFRRGQPPEATYRFKHALLQDAAYQSLLKSRRQQLHATIARVLEAQFPETVETHPELLAHHCTEAGLTEPAVGYWRRAGEHAVQRSAHTEAAAYFTRGLAVLETLPDTPERAQQELGLYLPLGAALITTKGYGDAEVERVFSRSDALCYSVGDVAQRLTILAGLYVFHEVRAQYRKARQFTEQMLTLAESYQDRGFLCRAHHAIGHPLLWMADLEAAQAHLEQSLTLEDLRQPYSVTSDSWHSRNVVARCYLAWALWLRGYPDRALEKMNEALSSAQQLAHPHTSALTFGFASSFHQFRREVAAAYERAEAAITISSEQGLPFWSALASMLRGWALQGEAGIEEILRGLAAYRAMGAGVAVSNKLYLLAETYEQAGQIEEGLIALAEAEAFVEKTEERFWEAEIYRLKGELLLQQTFEHASQAEACFRQALAVAHSQQAKSLELRAATSLARLWQSQDKRREAHDLLAPVYEWFTEGFDTADLQEAKALLDQLG